MSHDHLMIMGGILIGVMGFIIVMEIACKFMHIPGHVDCRLCEQAHEKQQHEAYLAEYPE